MPDRNRLLELALKGLEADRSKIDLERSQKLGINSIHIHELYLQTLERSPQVRLGAKESR
jgi:hypothetical protein